VSGDRGDSASGGVPTGPVAGYDTDGWARHFTGLGYAGAQPLASGVEGAVWTLGSGLIGKVWWHRRAGDLNRLGAFLDDLAHSGLPFDVPRHLDLGHGPGGLAWTLEPELDGHPLGLDVPGQSPELTPAVVEVLCTVHGELAQVAPTPALRSLPALAEDQPLLSGHRTFPGALAGLVDRRLSHTDPVLDRLVPGVTAVAAEVTAALRALTDTPDGVLHGDLFPPNVLIDDRGAPTAVVDFGWLSTVGDPAFDAAVTAGITDRYGPRAAANRDLLDAAMIERFAYPPERLSLYRVAYALTTAAWFDPAGRDGHTRWCAGILRGPDTARALLP